MLSVKRVLGTICTLALFGSGCDLLQTTSNEDTLGRGTTVFDPYSGNSPALRLGLHHYKGCATFGNGQMVAKGRSDIPYPPICESWDQVFMPGPTVPTQTIQLITGTPYFLGQLSLMDQLQDQLHSPEAAVNWLRTESTFKTLDWANLGMLWDRTSAEPTDPKGSHHRRYVNFAGANWMLREWTFEVEVFDENHNPVSRSVTGAAAESKVVYDRRDFLAENPASWHTNFGWTVVNQRAPLSPEDNAAASGDKGDPFHFLGPYAIANARLELSGSTNPFKQFVVPEENAPSGRDGYIKVTWSEMPQFPFYFPVTFVARPDIAATCFDEAGAPKACDFGLDPDVAFSRPANEKFYEPGENMELKFAIKDNRGNLLHPPDNFMSWTEYKNGEANGMLYHDFSPTFILGSTEHYSQYRIVGPIQNMRPVYDWQQVPFSIGPSFGRHTIGVAQQIGYQFPGADDTRAPTRVSYTIPADAQPGTYVAYVKVHRQFMGERFSKTEAFKFQVGQEEKTNYPGRVGNCQICHRGVISLENVLHGLSVDHVEGCKGCHTHGTGPASVSPLLDTFHRIHMSSEKYPLPKRDCTVCHLTRESALRPSIQVCNTCHPSIHGGKFFEMEHSKTEPNRFSNCAQACHADNPPSSHILPAE